MHTRDKCHGRLRFRGRCRDRRKQGLVSQSPWKLISQQPFLSSTAGSASFLEALPVVLQGWWSKTVWSPASYPKTCCITQRGLPSTKQPVEEKGTFHTDKIIQHLQWSSQRPVCLESSPVTLHIIPRGWICCKPGNYHLRKTAPKMDNKMTPAVPVNMCLHSTLFAESPGRFYRELWRCSNYRCPGLQSPSTTSRGAWAGSSSVLLHAPSAAQQRWPSCRKGRESHPILLFWYGTA